MSNTPPDSRPPLGAIQARLRALLVVLGVLVAVAGLAAPTASASTAADAQNGVAAINAGTASAVEPGAAVSPALVGVSGPLFDDGAVVSLVTPRAIPGTAIEPPWAQAPNRGFLACWSRTETICPGTVIDRYENHAGRFFSPGGTPFEARELPAGSGPLQRYEVLRPLDVQAGVVAPAFGQPGMGIQYMSSQTVAGLIEAGFLKAVG